MLLTRETLPETIDSVDALDALLCRPSQALIDDLDSRHGGIKGRLITDDGGLHRFVNIYVNDEDVRFTGSLDTELKDGDSVTILPAVAGG